MRRLNRSHRRWSDGLSAKGPLMSFPGAGEEGGREWDGEGSEVGGGSLSTLRGLRVPPALAHYSFLMVVTGAECGQGNAWDRGPRSRWPH